MEQQVGPADSFASGEKKNLPSAVTLLQKFPKKVKIIASLLAVVVLVGAVFLISNTKKSLKVSSGKPPTSITLKSEYKNPFKESTQYVNPFAEFKSPFINLQ